MNVAEAPAIDMAEPPPIESEVVDLIPRLRAYARTLTRDATDADDLVQETLLKALANIRSFERGTMLRAWLFTIMRNSFYTNVKKRARERPGTEDCVAGELTVPPDHDRYLTGKRLMDVIGRLPEHYREMLVLVVVLGESYEDAAAVCNVAVGTVKSRVNRARRLVIEAIGEDALRDLTAD